MWDKNRIYPKIETGYAYTKDMNDELVEKFNNQSFIQGSALLKIKYYYPKYLVDQHLSVKEREDKSETNRMRNRYITQVLTSVDIREIVKIGVKVIEIYESVLYRDNFKINPFEKVIDKLFALRQKHKKENNEVVQLMLKLILNALYGEFLREEFLESYQCKSEDWRMSEYAERVLDYQKLNCRNYIVKMKDDERLEDEVKKVDTLPIQLAVFILSNSKRIMNNFIHANIGFLTNDVYYTDTDSLYTENKH